jgi:hypothetical protein
MLSILIWVQLGAGVNGSNAGHTQAGAGGTL